MQTWWKALTRRWQRLRQLRPASLDDATLLVRVTLFAACVPLLCRLPLPRLRGWLEPPPTLRPSDDVGTLDKLDKIVRYVDTVIAVGKPVIRPSCLTRGLTLFYFLSRAGFDLTLCFGIGQPDGAFAGHCWLIRGDEPFLESTDPRPLFSETYRFYA